MYESCDYSHYTEISSTSQFTPSLELDGSSVVADDNQPIDNGPKYAKINKVHPKIQH